MATTKSQKGSLNDMLDAQDINAAVAQRKMPDGAFKSDDVEEVVEEEKKDEIEAPRTNYYVDRRVRWDSLSLKSRVGAYKRHGNPGHEGAEVPPLARLPAIASASPKEAAAKKNLHWSHADSNYVGMEPSLKRSDPWEMRPSVRRMTDAVLDQPAPPCGFEETAEVEFAGQFIKAEIAQMDNEVWERKQRMLQAAQYAPGYYSKMLDSATCHKFPLCFD